LSDSFAAKLGVFAVSIVSTQPRPMILAAIQSVSTTRSQPVSWPASRAGRIVPKKSSLALIVSR
jgi:hypothetical protein